MKTKYILNWQLVFILFVSMAQAQNQNDSNIERAGSELGVHVGPFLPNQIEGLSEIQPLWGLRYGAGLTKGMLELGGAASKANGVTYYNFSTSYRGEVPVEDALAIFYLGADFHYWTSPPSDEERMVLGGHMGAGLMLNISDIAWFRSDMKFTMNPGTGLYIGFGIALRFPEGGQGGGAN